jgi:Polyketide cyclase / dehydrase and lipid transport
MTRLHLEMDSPAAPQAAWELLSDFTRISFFNPNLSASHHIPGSPERGLGAARQCDLKGGKGALRERVTEWVEGQRYTVEITDSPLPVTGALATLAVAPQVGRGSRLSMTLTYKPRFGLAGRAMDALIMRRQMRLMLTGLLKGLSEKASARVA